MTDPLRPAVSDALAAWAARVRTDREQVDRSREVEDPADFYAPVTSRFRMDPRRADDQTLNVLLSLAQPEDVWLDVGSGAGRYALPLALAVREVVAIDPSAAMLAALREDAAQEGIANVRAVEGRWPLVGESPIGGVVLMAHIGYDIGEIGPFLDAAEAAASRTCVAVMGESAMTTVATLFWEAIHGEPRVRLPALPELLVLLAARNRIPEVRLVDRTPPTFGSLDEAQAMARRQLWLREGSAKDRHLRDLVTQTVTVREGRYAFEWAPTRIGIVSW
jgi:SAM-dependent methyltransferase